jgi:GTP diphosphokinase / guanosine-3',5'-bis(diphosphate) 3'-diphosphatase
MSHTGKWVEVQIRSTRMDDIAEKGYAAHWKYKDVTSAEGALDEWLARIRELLQSPESNALDFLDDFKLNLFADEIFLFSPKGDMFTLPVGATALDFGYNIHSQIGNTCIGAKVNHKLVPLSHKLKSGDQVEIITSDKQTPKQEWLSFVTTARAKTQIKEYIKEDRKKLGNAGKEKLKNYFKEIGLEFSTANLNKFLHYSGHSTINDLFCEVANDSLSLKEIKECWQMHEKEGFFRFLRMPFSRQKTEQRQPAPQTGLQIPKEEGLFLTPETESIKYALSPCCNPIPGDEVIGIIDIGGKIAIHRTNCQKAVELMSRYGNRLVKPKWTPGESLEFAAGIHISGFDRVGLMNEITKVISKQMNINMHSVNLASHDGLFEGNMMVYIHNTEQLRTLISSLKKINGIEKVTRIN